MENNQELNEERKKLGGLEKAMRRACCIASASLLPLLASWYTIMNSPEEHKGYYAVLFIASGLVAHISVLNTFPHDDEYHRLSKKFYELDHNIKTGSN